ncbi:LysR family transcriptional regulator [bacterium c-19]|nr:LysR family transcriptional regulator [bacterium c-19]
MIDYRLLTFMDLHETMNYTKTASNLNITQPAVTQHIKYLERKYKVSLFHYSRKHLELTKEGEYLYRYALNLLSNADQLLQELQHLSDPKETIKMGATLTIGEYLLPSLLIALYDRNEDLDLQLTLENTELLVKDVKDGKLDFALVEGIFNKEEFHTSLLKSEEMVLILPPKHPLVHRKTITLDDLLDERLFVREPGSGTREIFTQALGENNLSLDNFAKCTQISHINMIKEMVQGGTGISFLYESAVRKELVDHTLATRKVKGISLMREFNMISSKNSIYHEKIDSYFAFFKEHLV